MLLARMLVVGGALALSACGARSTLDDRADDASAPSTTKDAHPDSHADAGCHPLSSTCGSNAQCCSGLCLDGTCLPTFDGSACVPDFEACTDASQCCTGYCVDDVCGGGTSTCFPDSELCTSPDQCCSNVCWDVYGICGIHDSCAPKNLNGCLLCTSLNCCAEVAACLGSKKCDDKLTCVAECLTHGATETTCVAQCGGWTTPEGAALQTCASQVCSACQ
jgi:hypothetical protein